MKSSVLALFLLASLGLLSRNQSHARIVFCPAVMEYRTFCELAESAHLSAKIRIDSFSNFTNSSFWYTQSIFGEIQQIFYLDDDALSTAPLVGDSVSIYNDLNYSIMENRSYYMTLFINELEDYNSSWYRIPPCRSFSIVDWTNLEQKELDWWFINVC